MHLTSQTNYISANYSIIEIVRINDIIMLYIEKMPLRSGDKLYMIKLNSSNGFAETEKESELNMIHILICDDSRSFASQLRISVEASMKKMGIKVKIFEFHCAEEISTDVLSACDIAFLDIDFKGKNYSGLDIARRLRTLRNDAVIVFISNYIEYAPDGYEVQAFRYILKDEMPNKLETSVDKIIAHLQAKRSSIKIQSGGEIVDIPIQKIIFIESMGHTLIFHMMPQGRARAATHTCYSTLAKMEADLKDCGFLRIHKSYLVNMRHIQTLNCNEACMADGTKLSVSSRNYSECKKQYLLWRGQQ